MRLRFESYHRLPKAWVPGHSRRTARYSQRAIRYRRSLHLLGWALPACHCGCTFCLPSCHTLSSHWSPGALLSGSSRRDDLWASGWAPPGASGPSAGSASRAQRAAVMRALSRELMRSRVFSSSSGMSGLIFGVSGECHI